MQAILILSILTIILFVIAFVSKRKFGVLGLSLAAGLVLSEAWAYELSLIAGIFRIGADLASVAMIKCFVIILPALILMLHGAKYKTTFGRIIGSLIFTLLALAFLVEPLANVLSLSGNTADVYMRFVNQKNLFIGVGLILSLLDVFLVKHGKDKEKKSQH